MPSPPFPNLATCNKLGFIVPSSNTVLEPTCNAIAATLNAANSSTEPELLCLYTRIAVRTVGTDSSSTSQFSTQTLVDAAILLADANCDAILWNGTSGMWVGTGLAEEETLAAAMGEATGVPCSTTTLATVAALGKRNCGSIGLAVPYTEALTEKLVQFFTREGFEVLRVERLEPTPGSNLEIGKSAPGDVESVIERASVQDKEYQCPNAVVVACTNWPGAGIARKIEEDSTHTDVLDSVTVTMWMGLKMIGYEGACEGWGRLLSEGVSR